MTLYNLVAYVKRARNRKKVFQSIEKEMMPSEIVAKIYGKSSNTYFNLVSRALAELKKKKLVEVVNPRDRTGRFYKKTKLGKRVEEKIKEMS